MLLLHGTIKIFASVTFWYSSFHFPSLICKVHDGIPIPLSKGLSLEFDFFASECFSQQKSATSTSAI